MADQNSEVVMQQVQAELANAYAQEFFTVRLPLRRPRAQIPRAFRPPARHLPPSRSSIPSPTLTGCPASAPTFSQTVREKCFAKCVTKPGTSLSSGETTCISRCTDRYVDATRAISNVVLQAYSQGGGMQ
jgi:import inner membrane translocase subunit TIM13